MLTSYSLIYEGEYQATQNKIKIALVRPRDGRMESFKRPFTCYWLCVMFGLCSLQYISFIAICSCAVSLQCAVVLKNVLQLRIGVKSVEQLMSAAEAVK